MKLALLCDVGCEPFAAEEVKELVAKAAELKTGYVTLEGSLNDAFRLCYLSQSASRVLAVIAEGRIANPRDIPEQSLADFDYGPFKPENFAAVCDRIGDHPFQAHEIEERIGTILHDRCKLKVDLTNPTMEVFCQVRNESFAVGVDLAGRDLGKRDHKAFHTRRSLRSTVAYCVLRSAGYNRGMIVVDPFANDGTIAIEAALRSTGISPQRFRKDFTLLKIGDWNVLLERFDTSQQFSRTITAFTDNVRTVKMARANAKLAGVEDAISFTKCEVSWLDTKFKEQSVDLIATLPPVSSKNTPLKDVEKTQDDLFYQAKYVLKPTGTIVLVTTKKAEFLNASTRHGFKLADEREVWMGKTRLLYLLFARGYTP